MSVARLKRIAALEARRPAERPWVDISPWVIPVFMAMLEGRPFSWLPSPEPSKPRSEESEAARRRVLAESDTIRARLTKDDPEATAGRARRKVAAFRCIR
jgi:hypothetical protein